MLLSGNAGQSTSLTYDNNGNLLTSTDALNHRTINTYDAQDRPWTSKAPDGGTITYGYDNAGYLYSIKDGRGVVTTYARNGLGDLVTLSSHDSGSTSYTPDNFGRMTSESRANGKSISYHWDALDRLSYRTSGTSTDLYYYDQGTYGKGKLTGFSDGSGSTGLTYDSNGHIARQDTTVYGTTYSALWNYDGAGRLSTMTYPSGMVLTYHYDATGRVSSISTNLPSWPTLASGFLYQPATERMYAYVAGNGIVQATTLDTDGRIASIASPGVQSHAYSYFKDNTVSAISDAVVPALAQSFTYDANARLQSVTRTNDNQSFSWDFSGNRTTSVRAGISSTPVTDAGSNRITSFGSRGFGYSGSGQIVQDGQRVFGFDAFDG